MEWQLPTDFYKTLRSPPSFSILLNIFNDNSQGLLSLRGRFYLVALKQNDIPSIRSRMLEAFGLFSQVKSARE